MSVFFFFFFFTEKLKLKICGNEFFEVFIIRMLKRQLDLTKQTPDDLTNAQPFWRTAPANRKLALVGIKVDMHHVRRDTHSKWSTICIENCDARSYSCRMEEKFQIFQFEDGDHELICSLQRFFAVGIVTQDNYALMTYNPAYRSSIHILLTFSKKK